MLVHVCLNTPQHHTVVTIYTVTKAVLVLQQCLCLFCSNMLIHFMHFFQDCTDRGCEAPSCDTKLIINNIFSMSDLFPHNPHVVEYINKRSIITIIYSWAINRERISRCGAFFWCGSSALVTIDTLHNRDVVVLLLLPCDSNESNIATMTQTFVDNFCDSNDKATRQRCCCCCCCLVYAFNNGSFVLLLVLLLERICITR